jgi:hypothetical protein
MTAVVEPYPIFRGVDNNGNALTGGQLFTYTAGTTTKLATYTDSTGNTANTNPVVLNSRGEANVWLTSGTSYKFVLSPSTDTDPPTNPYWTVDNLQGGVPGTVSAAMAGFVNASSLAAAAAILLPTGQYVQGVLCSATINVNTLNSQAFSAIGTLPAKFRIVEVVAYGTTLSLTTLQGGIAAASADGSTQITPTTTAFTSLTTATKLVGQDLGTGTLEQYYTALPTFTATVAQGSAGTVTIAIVGYAIP